MPLYVLTVDLGDDARPLDYQALNGIMGEYGFLPRGPEPLRPAQFSIASRLPWVALKSQVNARVAAEFHGNPRIVAYEIKVLVD